MFGPAELPLVVDLDGTLIFNDSSRLTLQRYLRKEPHGIFLVASWWIRGNAFVKRELAKRVPVTCADFDYNEKLIEALRIQKKSGRQLILATGADYLIAKRAVDSLDLFSDIIASDGRNNCISFKKAALLNERFGRKKYVYAGNSTQDYAVWVDSAYAVAVNAPPEVRNKLSYINVPQSVFDDKS